MDPLFVYGWLLTNTQVFQQLYLLLKSKQHMHSGKSVMDWMCYLPISTTAHYQCAQVTALAVKQ